MEKGLRTKIRKAEKGIEDYAREHGIETYKNKEWEYRMEIYGLIFLLVLALTWGAIGWHKYRQERNYNEGFEITQFEPLGGI